MMQSKPINTLEIDGVKIECREDGYIDATALCKAACKNFSHWNANKKSKEFVDRLSKLLRIQINQIIILARNPHEHTYVHPLVATNVAQWISSDFSARVSVWLEEWKSAKIENNVKYMDALNNLKVNGNHQLEFSVKNRLAANAHGKVEVETPVGFIDIETADEIIEVKHVSKWKHAMGQILSYNVYKNKKCRIHLFYDSDETLLNLDATRHVCNQFNVRCTVEKIILL